MWKWLRSWFAWRFSLIRLVVAVVFLGAFVGMNALPKIVNDGTAEEHNYGWPMEFHGEWGINEEDGQFTALATGFYPGSLILDLGVALAGLLGILLFPLNWFQHRLRSWFAWRFSLTRLVVAVVFLAAFVGLNMREIGPIAPFELDLKLNFYPTKPWPKPEPYVGYYYGWPFPAYSRTEPIPLSVKNTPNRDRSSDYELPFTHQTYRIMNPLVTWNVREPRQLVSGAIINTLVAIISLALILFLQIPRRKVAAKEGGRGA